MSGVAPIEPIVIPVDVWYDQYEPGENWVELEEARTQPDQHVWTIVECDGVLAALAGYHHVNRIGSYAVTRKPWQTGEEEVYLDSPCDCDSVDAGGCEVCMPPPVDDHATGS